MEIVERIKTLCKEKGTTMGTLEKELGLGNGSIRRWDEKVPGADKILLLANRLEVTTDWLLTGKESKDLNSNEQKLINIYRDTNDIGQTLIIQQADSIQQILPRKEERKSSNTKIG